jgi:hypothetical protein
VLRHTISESAAQGLPAAIWARSGLALMGIGAALASLGTWPGPTAWALRAFALAMAASAVWGHRPWLPDVGFDASHDRAHAVAAQAAGVAFVMALLGRVAARWALQRQVDGLDAAALFAAVAVPLSWVAGIPWPGAAQRAMFALAYAWLLREAWTLRLPASG